MILTFQDLFVPKIKNGSKPHSLRRDRAGRWKAGRQIDFYRGRRFKPETFKRFKVAPCTGTQDIDIQYFRGGAFKIFIGAGNKPLDLERSYELMKNDGFETPTDFFKWFFPGGAGRFTGKIIHWTELRY